MLVRCGSGLGGLHLLFEMGAMLRAVAGSANDHGLCPVEQAIETCGGQEWIAEDLRPFAGGAVGGEQDGAFFVAFGTSLFILRGSFIVRYNAVDLIFFPGQINAF